MFKNYLQYSVVTTYTFLNHEWQNNWNTDDFGVFSNLNRRIMITLTPFIFLYVSKLHFYIKLNLLPEIEFS